MTIRAYIQEGKTRLESAKLECADPLLHMKQIVEASLGISSTELIMKWESELSAGDTAKIEKWMLRRLQGEPFQYIAGYEWFWDSKFSVGPGVLIPRPETELLVELALDRCPQKKIKVGELGAGSGIIGITLLRERPSWEWFACETNRDSYPYLEENMKLLPKGAQYSLKRGDFFEVQTPFDWVIANPPYVRRSEIPSLSREVRFEPASALDGGETGAEVVKRVIAHCRKLLRPTGSLLLEIGSDQGAEVLQALKDHGYRDVSIEKDAAGRDRVACGTAT